ncbi:MAG: hypothetical protein JWM88_958, partial [Verrucomicrobia bacterium]|nr:hypothetical protein [Verrucomicrobiota bacterium]
IVQKMIGLISIVTSLMNASARGLSDAPNAGQRWPQAAPMATAIRT